MIDCRFVWSIHRLGSSEPVFLGIMSGLRMLGAVGALSIGVAKVIIQFTILFFILRASLL